MMIYGVDKAADFNTMSPVFTGYDASVLYSLKYRILGITSTLGYEGYKLNIYKLALFNRVKYMEAQERG